MKVLALVASAVISLSAVGSSSSFKLGDSIPAFKPVSVAAAASLPFMSISTPVGMNRMGVATPLDIGDLNLGTTAGQEAEIRASDLATLHTRMEGALDSANAYAFKAAFLNGGAQYDAKLYKWDATLSPAALAEDADSKDYKFDFAAFRLNYAYQELDYKDISVKMSDADLGHDGSVTGRFFTIMRKSGGGTPIKMYFRVKCVSFRSSPAAHASCSPNITASQHLMKFSSKAGNFRNFLVYFAPDTFVRSANPATTAGSYTGDLEVTFTVA